VTGPAGLPILGITLATLALVVVLLILWWRRPQISASPRPTYQCLVTKNIVVPKKDWDWGLATGGGMVALTKAVDLAFPPQIGMSISGFTPLPVVASKDGGHFDVVRFHSGRIENINWKIDRNQYECVVAAHEVADKDELGVMLIRHIVYEGWSFDVSSFVITASAVSASLERWLREVEDKERGADQPLSKDREELDRVRRVLRHNGYSGA
jgi:hypothetical protein